MALPNNPLATLVTQTAQTLEAQTAESAANLEAATPSLINAAQEAAGSVNTGELNSLVSNLSGDIGTAFNGATAGLQNAASALGNVAGSVANVAAGVADTIGSLTGGFATAGGIGSSLLSVARNISSAAGVIGNLLSMFRGRNIPAGADLFEQVGGQVSVSAVAANDWRVRLSCDFSTLFGSGAFARLSNTNGLVWPYTPSVTIVSRANYTQTDPVHNNFPFQSYKNSQIEDIQISGEFSAETQSDAEYWVAATTFLRTATKMFYGASGNQTGNPPVICKLTGYGTQVFNNVPVIIKSFQVDMPEDSQYVQCNVNGSPTWVPILSTISVTVAPIYNRERLRKFNLQNFAAGREVGML